MAKKEAVPKLTSRQLKQQRGLICDNLSFAAAESYKLLRTNLQFSLPEKPCHTIGVTSSLRGEGKSTTSVNIAYTFAQSGKKVLLIDADMRLPSIAAKLDMHGTPGLSNLIAGLNSERSCLRQSKYFENWYIIPAGDIPPNPSELLGSERMHSLLERYQELFDVIILDLPPVNIVTDALAVSKWTDGLIGVVRQDYTDRRALADCMYQVDKLGVKFLGFVMTDAKVGEGSYKRYGKYGKKYGKGYGYGYDYGYEVSQSSSAGNKKKAFIEATTDSTADAVDEEFAVPDSAEEAAGPDKA